MSSSWSRFLHGSTSAIFLVDGKTGRLRFVNAAWERLVGRTLEQVRGTRIATQRRSVSPFWRALSPPAEVQSGRSVRVRRAVPPATTGPPWWEVEFLPLPAQSGLLGILGVITPVGESLPKGLPHYPDWLADLQRRFAAQFPIELFAGSSLPAQRLLVQAQLAAKHSEPLWLEGEAGTGKRTLALSLHQIGPRPDRACLTLAVSSLKPYLLESLLFSPGGLVHSNQVGSVYFRDADHLPPELQARVLNWSRRPGVPRLVFGSREVIENPLKQNQILPAFYTRMTAHRLTLPPLRDQGDDLPFYCSTILRQYGRKESLPDSMIELFRQYPWPGNFRELARVIASLRQKPLEVASLPRHLQELRLYRSPRPQPPRRSLDAVLETIENQLVRLALQRHPNKPTAICEELGLTRMRLNKILARLNPTIPGQG